VSGTWRRATERSSLGPTSYPYSPECLEEEFSEVGVLPLRHGRRQSGVGPGHSGIRGRDCSGAGCAVFFAAPVRLLLLFGEPVFAVRLALARGVQWLQPGLLEFGAGGLMARVLNWVAALRNRTSRTFYSRRLLVAD
jgi:hypothetical protein